MEVEVGNAVEAVLMKVEVGNAVEAGVGNAVVEAASNVAGDTVDAEAVDLEAGIIVVDAGNVVDVVTRSLYPGMTQDSTLQWAFVGEVYLIMAVQLLVTAVIISPFNCFHLDVFVHPTAANYIHAFFVEEQDDLCDWASVVHRIGVWTGALQLFSLFQMCLGKFGEGIYACLLQI